MRKTNLLLIMLCLLLTACGSPGGEEGNIEIVPAEDAEMNAAIQEARDSLPEFIQALQSPTDTQTHFAIKVRFPYGKAGAAEMVAVQIREHAALPHGHALTAQVVVFGHRRSREAHVIHCHPTIGHVVEQLHAHRGRVIW